MIHTYLSIPETLKHLRESADLTQTELAQFFGTDATLIEKWESGITEPSISEALILSKVFGCSLDEMLAYVDPRNMIPPDALETYDYILSKNRIFNRWYD